MLEEQAQAKLHDTATVLSIDAAEGWIVGVIVNRRLAGLGRRSKRRMVEDVRGFCTKFDVTILVVAEKELLQHGRIGVDTVSYTHLAPFHRETCAHARCCDIHAR